MSEKKKWPYLQAIQDQRQKIAEVYDTLNALRDRGTYEEKKMYNSLRGYISPLFEMFEKLELEIISSKRADMKL